MVSNRFGYQTKPKHQIDTKEVMHEEELPFSSSIPPATNKTNANIKILNLNEIKRNTGKSKFVGLQRIQPVKEEVLEKLDQHQMKDGSGILVDEIH